MRTAIIRNKKTGYKGIVQTFKRDFKGPLQLTSHLKELFELLGNVRFDYNHSYVYMMTMNLELTCILLSLA